MILREDLEKREYMIYCEAAAKADASRGRARAEEKCRLRTEFQRDRDNTSFQGIQETDAQDTGVSGSGGRPFQDKTYSYAGGVADSQNHCKRTGAQRGSDRGHRSGARSGTYTFRA